MVAPRKFVTAAHCVIGDDGRPRAASVFSVFLARSISTDFDSAERPVVSAATLHPDYAEDVGRNPNDVGVLMFAAVPAPSAAPARLHPAELKPAQAAGTRRRTRRIIRAGATRSEGQETRVDERPEADRPPMRSDAGTGRRATRLSRPGPGRGVRRRSRSTPVVATPGCASRGGPLLGGRHGTAFVLAAWSLVQRLQRQGVPGSYTRVGAQPQRAGPRPGRQASTSPSDLVAARGRAGRLAASRSAGASAPGTPFMTVRSTSHGAVGHARSSASAAQFEAVLRITDAQGAAEQRHELAVAPVPQAPPPPPPATTPPATTPGAAATPPASFRLAHGSSPPAGRW